MSKICHIIGAAPLCGLDTDIIKKSDKDDLIIAADGGFVPLIKNDIAPSILIGDFDSLDINEYKLPEGIEIIRLKPEKDFTDVHSAILHAINLGYDDFRLYGVIGGARIEHTIANLSLLSWLAAEGMNAVIYSPQNIFKCLHNSTVTFDDTHSGFISVFSTADKSCGVNISGLKYELSDAILTNTYPLGVSNEFIPDKKSSISVSDGTLLIIYSR